MTLVAIWIFCAGLVGLAAQNHRGRDPFAWFALSVLISPLLAGALLLVSKTLDPNAPPSPEPPTAARNRLVARSIALGSVGFVILALVISGLLQH